MSWQRLSFKFCLLTLAYIVSLISPFMVLKPNQLPWQSNAILKVYESLLKLFPHTIPPKFMWLMPSSFMTQKAHPLRSISWLSHDSLCMIVTYEAAEASRVNEFWACRWVLVKSEWLRPLRIGSTSCCGHTLCSLESSSDVGMWPSQCQWRWLLCLLVQINFHLLPSTSLG